MVKGKQELSWGLLHCRRILYQLSYQGSSVMEKEMTTHSSNLAWKIPWTEKPGRLQSMGSQKVRHDWATSLLHRNGETDSGRAQTEHCVHQDPGERSSDPTGTSPRLARECPGVSGGGVGQWWPAAGWGALSVAVPAWDLLKEVTIIFITSTGGAFLENTKNHKKIRAADDKI